MKTGVRRFAFGFLSAVLSVSLVLAGCGGSTTTKPAETPAPAPTEAPKPAAPIVGGTFINTTIGDAKILLPILTGDTSSSYITSLVYDPLLTRDDKLNYHDGLAKEYTIEQDRIYTFKLHEGVKFHDGQPLTSADVYFTFAAIAHPKYTGVRFGSFTGIKGWKELGDEYEAVSEELEAKKIDDKTADDRKMAAYEKFLKESGMSTPDPLTFRVELSEPFAPFLNSISGYGIMPKHLLEPHIANLQAAPEAKKPIGTGAYKFVNWVKDDHITLVRNPDWKYGVKQSTNHIDRVIVKTIPDQQANMVALETGETDTASILPDQFDHFKNNVQHVNVVSGMTFSYTYMGYNLTNPLFSDARVRRAITHAINRQEIVDKLLLGHGSLANGHGSPVRWDYNPNVPVYEFSVEKAEKLLDEAGWTKGADGIRAKGGQKFAFELATNNGNKIREQSAVIIQQALKKVGIEANVNLMEWNAFLDHVDSAQKEAYILGWSLGFDPDAHVIFHTDGGFNMMHGYSNTRVDELIERGRKVTDQNMRADIYKEMQTVLAEDQVYTWLFFSNAISGVNKRVAGVPTEVTPAGLSWNFEEWHLLDAKAAR